MGSTAPSVDGGNGLNNCQHSAAKGSQNGPVSASEEPHKDAPLQPDDERHDSSSHQQRRITILRRMWHWSVRNMTVIALVCLVFGGLVTIIVSFGGWFLRVHS